MTEVPFELKGRDGQVMETAVDAMLVMVWLAGNKFGLAKMARHVFIACTPIYTYQK